VWLIAGIAAPVFTVLTWFVIVTPWANAVPWLRVVIGPGLVVLLVVWLGLGARWALGAVPDISERLKVQMSGRARKAYAFNALLLLVASGAWSVITHSIRALYLAATAVVMLSFVWFSIGTIISMAAVGSLYRTDRARNPSA
jgi:hypothetical protein